MKLVLTGGSGHVGRLLARELSSRGHHVVVLGRRPVEVPGATWVHWDGRSAGPWWGEVDGADAVVNLAGRSVGCRYTEANLPEMMDSRVDSTRAVGQAIARAVRPPRVWLQMSTATIYAHRFDRANDEATGVLGGAEPGVPAYWKYSVDIARNWEAEAENADTPRTRRVLLRTAMVMSPGSGGVFHALRWLVRLGVGGAVAGGRQYVSWIHGQDFVHAVEFLLEHEAISGPVNLAAPRPLPQREFMRGLRHAMGVPLGVPSTRWLAEVGAFVRRADTELLLKSRRVVPGRLLEAGFGFRYPDWDTAARELVRARVPAPGPG
ncbi:uncharacterized protein (TIGR01777 family) [Crossiella equi]|uniref:Uncharacterized protein (TIGR01777 family) n=1 Tax=Crossiella equi TaxID=130796 RepID=A0ABS5AQ35_9PSEU|nr:TIGR01777 family oxidoreductase [Crossiella equi]MBP2478688.1 uncharacterized protein (TIGR01777 family) [Crossiella equi]